MKSCTRSIGETEFRVSRATGRVGQGTEEQHGERRTTGQRALVVEGTAFESVSPEIESGSLEIRPLIESVRLWLPGVSRSLS